jgi:hypothetical protein
MSTWRRESKIFIDPQMTQMAADKDVKEKALSLKDLILCRYLRPSASSADNVSGLSRSRLKQ